MDLLDGFLLAMILLAAASGYRRGAMLQIFIYGGLLLGLAVGTLLAPRLATLVSGASAQAAVALGTLLGLVVIGDALGWLIGKRLWVATRGSRFGVADSVTGSLVAVTALLIATWFLGVNLATGPSRPLAHQIRGSAIIRAIDAVLPAPPSLLEEIRRFLNHYGFPEVFAGLPPPPGGPVDEPSQRQARQAFERAAGSTVRVIGTACGRVQEGSGFVVAPSYIVTNAHVVAGEESTTVQRQNGGSLPATPVLFDPRLDIAILRVSRTPGPVLTFAQGEVDRGARGAVVGYPQGGALTGEAAANRRVVKAVGRDIYGHGTVTRQIYEIQSIVRPGNSGGPFILVGGRVAGVVFASSTTDPDLGYAITSDEVRPDVRSGIARTERVSTGGCAE